MVLGIPKAKLDKLPPLKSWEKGESRTNAVNNYNKPWTAFLWEENGTFPLRKCSSVLRPMAWRTEHQQDGSSPCSLGHVPSKQNRNSTTVHGRPWAWLTCILKLLFPIRIPNTMRLGWLSFLLYTDPPYVGDIVFTGSFFQASDSHLLQL